MKIIIMLLGSLAFVAGGFIFIIDPAKYASIFNGHQLPVIIAGYASIIFFGVCAFALVRKAFSNAPGLLIDKNGITDNSSGVSVGFIGWNDITKLSVSQVAQQNFIMVHVSDPDSYIQRQHNIFERKALAANYDMYGTPISITANGLKCDFDELFSLLTTGLIKYKKE